ncbi:MAG TPA: hypothetical protein VMU95_41210 [Trebonia sp.]|nr:hypothetical protein [Trebonia sp.]
MSAEERTQIASRARKLATGMDRETIAMRQRGAPHVPVSEAVDALAAVAPLAQAVIRYQLAMLDVIRTADYATRDLGEFEDDDSTQTRPAEG